MVLLHHISSCPFEISRIPMYLKLLIWKSLVKFSWNLVWSNKISILLVVSLLLSFCPLNKILQLDGLLQCFWVFKPILLYRGESISVLTNAAITLKCVSHFWINSASYLVSVDMKLDTEIRNSMAGKKQPETPYFNCAP